MRRTYTNITKAVYDRSTTNIVLHSETLRAFLLTSGKKKRMLTLTTCTQHSIENLRHSNQAIKRSKIYPNWKGRNKTVIIYR